jgi:hypothetical protein
VVEEVEDGNLVLTLECEQTPCDASWVIYQPEINKINAGQLGQGLFTLE